MTESYDALIVGAGPAGLSATLILGRCRRRVLLCDSGVHRNSASQAIHGLLGHEGCPPSELLAIGSRELKNYAAVTHSRSEVLTIVPSKGGFEFTHSDGKGFARKVLLATGLVDEVPDLAGIDDLYGRSVHHCLYCDGFEHSGEPIAAYGAGDKGAGLALMMTQWSPDVILCTGGEAEVTPPMAQRLAERGIKIFPDRIVGLKESAASSSGFAFRTAMPSSGPLCFSRRAATRNPTYRRSLAADATKRAALSPTR